MAGLNLGTASGSIEVNTSGLKNADLALRSSGRSMINFGEQAIGAFANIVDSAAKFDANLSFVQAVTAATSDQMEALRQTAIKLGKDSVYGPIALTQAFIDLAQAGATTEQIVNGLGKATVDLAQAADIPVATAGIDLINILNQYGLGVEKAQHAADLLAGASNASTATIDDLATSLKYVGPAAKGVGVSLEDTASALGLLANQGIRGSQAGTGLREVLLDLNGKTKQAKEALKSLGIEVDKTGKGFQNAKGDALPFAQIFQILQDKTRGLTDLERQDIFNKIFGKRAITAVQALTAAGKQGFEDMAKAEDKATATDVATKRLDNLAGSVKRLKSTLEALKVEAGEPFQNMLKGFVDGIRSVILFIEALPGPVKTGIVAFIGIVGVLSVVAGAFLLTIGNIVRMVRVLGEIKNALGIFSSAARAATVANEEMSASFLLNPITLIIAAIIALGVAFYLAYTKVKSFREFINFLWQDIQKGWDGVLKGFRDVGKNIGNAIDATVRFFKKIPDAVSGAADAVGRFFRDFGKGVAAGFLGTFEKIGSFFKSLGSSIKELAGAGLEKVVSGLEGAGSAIVRFFKSLPGTIGSALETALGAVGRFLAVLPERIAFGLGFAIGRVLRWGIDLVKLFIKIGGDVIDAVVTFFEAIPGVVERAVVKVVTVIANFGVVLIKAWLKVMKGMFDGLVTFFKAVPGALAGFFTTIIRAIIDALPSIGNAAVKVGGSILNGILTFLKAVPGAVLSILTTIVSAIGNAVITAGSAALRLGSAVFEGIISFFRDLPGRIVQYLLNAVEAVGGFIKSFFDKAKSIGESLWNGFKKGLFGSPHTKIEYAMWDMEANMKTSISNLKGHVRTLQGMERRLPRIDASALGLPSPGEVAVTSNGGGNMFNQNAPLIGSAVIRDERDAVTLGRSLAQEQQRLARARGQRLVGAGV